MRIYSMQMRTFSPDFSLFDLHSRSFSEGTLFIDCTSELLRCAALFLAYLLIYFGCCVQYATRFILFAALINVCSKLIVRYKMSC